jgi:hypothetical protein
MAGHCLQLRRIHLSYCLHTEVMCYQTVGKQSGISLCINTNNIVNRIITSIPPKSLLVFHL